MGTPELTLDIERLPAEDRTAILEAIRICRLVLRGQPVPAWFAAPPSPDNTDLKRILRGMDLLEPIITRLVAVGDQRDAEEAARPHADRRRCARCLRSIQREEWESYQGCPSCGHTEWVAVN